MYETLPPRDIPSDQALRMYTAFLASRKLFERGLNRVVNEWPISCEQFLTNTSINRIAWLGQSSMCITSSIPSRFKAGFSALPPEAQLAANKLAGEWLSMWELCNGEGKENPPDLPTPKGLHSRIEHYIKTWERRGYEDGIPDEVPSELMRLNLAPSHKAIALAVLKNDHALSSLGYTQPVSPWYNVIKKIEIEARTK